ncbi:hypothetical protein CAPTEDRAFT_228784 [Capitella teleta]|uniref:Uncharacterized protein n=1 Tax=Capitella teleta TaxID=283909 RepID=R7TDG6_CAPTE|nr:hypothetical protein CAPTEDRAFT_228784 [Capitella teleta]|eukprot:ELT89106.1 hypothetical protein CAPTEDRAFT_228784 [Capitella teleta]
METKTQAYRRRETSVIYVFPGIPITGRSLALEDVREGQYHDGQPRLERKHSISSEPGCDVKVSIQARRPHMKASSGQPGRFSGLPGLGRSSSDVPTRHLHTGDNATYKESSSSARRYSRLNEKSIVELLRVKQRMLKEPSEILSSFTQSSFRTFIYKYNALFICRASSNKMPSLPGSKIPKQPVSPLWDPSSRFPGQRRSQSLSRTRMWNRTSVNIAFGRRSRPMVHRSSKLCPLGKRLGDVVATSRKGNERQRRTMSSDTQWWQGARHIHSQKSVKGQEKSPLLRFRRAAKTIMFLIKATRTSQNQQKKGTDPKNMSFSQFQDEIMTNNRSFYGTDLFFDPLYYKPQREVRYGYRWFT